MFNWQLKTNNMEIFQPKMSIFNNKKNEIYIHDKQQQTDSNLHVTFFFGEN